MNRTLNLWGLAVVCLIGWSMAEPASGVTISSSVNGVIFYDDFENDTLAALPVISGSNVGSGYTQISAQLANTDIANNSTTVGLSQTRPGQFLNIANDSLNENGRLQLNFAAELAGASVTASFYASLGENTTSGPGTTPGSTLRISYKNGTTHVSTQHLYLATGRWATGNSITLPAGVTVDDVVLMYYNGSSYQFGTVAGNAAAARIDAGEGTWFGVSFTQAASIGSQPVFSLNGVTLDPVPMGASVGTINGLEFGTNGGDFSQAYVDAQAVPEPSSFLLLALSAFGFVVRCRRSS